MRRKIVIKNHTHWRTDHIRAFIHRAADMVLDPEQKPRLHATVTYTRVAGQGWASGCAWVGGNSFTVRLDHTVVDKVDFAGVIGHEIGHCKGLHHRDMRGNAYYKRGGKHRELYAWAKELPLEKRAIKVKVPVTGVALVEKKLEHAQKMAAKWQVMTKRAQARAKRWQRKVKYHEARLARLKAAENVSTNK
jgi:hypothetical protein